LASNDVKKETTKMREIGRIFTFLGVAPAEGQVKADHLHKILNYLIDHQEGNYKMMLARLSLSCQMDRRKLRENYIEGIEAWGIIVLSHSGNMRKWIWKGLDNVQI
jgi:hypothetical protein